ncbi:sensor histidine kinase [Paenibacillus sp. N1-5-1-14]|uniref:sensor histidine kinase n=1 Tax=Paenibacillus radicibacter TaxID=2972488 RepID=UPI002159362C|nr:sensor histidine kinase [Paenibacillus radicibacter]MCR8645173.1 sensor histidine kinase [Paenibacillus radicibacter]
MKLFRSNAISVSVFRWFLLYNVVLFSVITFGYYKTTTDQINAGIAEVSRRNVLQAADHFGLLMKGYDSISKSITANLDIQRLLSRDEPNPVVQEINSLTLQNILGSIYYSRDDIIGLYIITNSGKVYSYGSYTQVIDEHYASAPWYNELRKSTGQMTWFGVRNTSLINTMQAEPVFSFGRSLYNIYENKPIGIVLIETEPKGVMNTIDNLHIKYQGEAYVLSYNNRLLAYSGFPEKAPPVPIDIPSFAEDEHTQLINTPGYLTVVEKQNPLNWKIVSLTPNSNFNNELDKNKRFIFLVLGIMVVISIGISMFFSRVITAPIKKMVHEMKQVERGKFNILQEVKSFDEINYLIASFNRMVSQIDQLIERVRFASISEKNAQLHALQSQVNPHFLYNTLDMIYWMLDEKENEQLGNIILSLSKMFRYSSDWEHSDVTLHDELEQASNYLMILQARADGQLSVQLDVPEEWLSIRLPKMSLQPIIENAIIHGLTVRGGPGKVSLGIEQVGNRLEIRIQDDGIGIGPEKLLDLQMKLMKSVQEEVTSMGSGTTEPSSTEQGIGLLNVHRRIAMKFGAQYGIHMESIENVGTTVSILIPLDDQGGVI